MSDVFFLDFPSAQGVMAVEIVSCNEAHLHPNVGGGLTFVAEPNILLSTIKTEQIITPSIILPADLPPQPR